ncbi:MAG: GNAT family N-acetyltransferase [Chloroflexi bacterium]|nr:GNAT family N-acetyltransferase [Chloroflexota bacterium]
MNDRRRIEQEVSFTFRNAPLRPRARQALLDAPGTVHLHSDEGELILADDRGQQRVYWAFTGIEGMRRDFPEMWQHAKEDLDPETCDYVTMDLAALPTRDWLMPLLNDTDFEFFAEWMEMAHPALDANVVPEFPAGVKMRKGTGTDVDRMREIWTAAHGDYAEGPRTWDWILDEAGWVGALEDSAGDLIAFAINGHVERGEGEVLAAAVAPEAWGNGYGRLVLDAATYQLAASEAVKATIRVRPDIRNALRTASDAGFRHVIAGVEFRRSLDEAGIAAKREERRRTGVKARYGKWR